MELLGPGRFRVKPAEEITVRVDEDKTAFAVGYAINNFRDKMIDNTPLTFKTVKDPTHLVLAAGFSGTGGGSYRVVISGSDGGDPFKDTMEQVGRSKIDIHEYEFVMV
jgi:hypothetical protein